MKRFYFVLPLVLLLIRPGTSSAQSIPNPGFETWSGTNPLLLTGWTINYYPAIQGFSSGASPVTRSTTAHTGSYSLQGSVVTYTLTGIGTSTVPPLVVSNWFSNTGRPASLTGYYRFTSVGGDSLSIVALLEKNNSGIAVADADMPQAAAWTKFTLPITYVSPETADSAWIEFAVTNPNSDTVHVGTVFLLDDLAFEGVASGISASNTKPSVFALEQNYPNPFNPSTMIRFELPEASQVRLAVYNLLGEELAVLVNEHRQAGTYDLRFDGSGLASGTYFYRIEARQDGGSPGGSFVQVRKMTIVK